MHVNLLTKFRSEFATILGAKSADTVVTAAESVINNLSGDKKSVINVLTALQKKIICQNDPKVQAEIKKINGLITDLKNLEGEVVFDGAHMVAKNSPPAEDDLEVNEPRGQPPSYPGHPSSQNTEEGDPNPIGSNIVVLQPPPSGPLPQNAQYILERLKKHSSQNIISAVIKDISGPPGEVLEFLKQLQKIVEDDTQKTEISRMIEKVQECVKKPRCLKVDFRPSFSHEVGPIDGDPAYNPRKEKVQLEFSADSIFAITITAEGVSEIVKGVEQFCKAMQFSNSATKEQLDKLLEKLEDVRKSPSAKKQAVEVAQAIGRVKYLQAAAKLYDQMKTEYGDGVADTVFSPANIKKEYLKALKSVGGEYNGKVTHPKRTQAHSFKVLESACKKEYLLNHFEKNLVEKVWDAAASDGITSLSKEALVLRCNNTVINEVTKESENVTHELLKAAMQDLYTPAERKALGKGQEAINKDRLQEKIKEFQEIQTFIATNKIPMGKGTLKAADYLAFKKQLDIHVKNLNEKFFSKLGVTITPAEVLKAANEAFPDKKVFVQWLRGKDLHSDHVDRFFINIVKTKKCSELESFKKYIQYDKGPIEIKTIGKLIEMFEDFALKPHLTLANDFLREVSARPFKHMKSRELLEAIQKENGGSAVADKLLRQQPLNSDDESLFFRSLINAREKQISNAAELLAIAKQESLDTYIGRANEEIRLTESKYRSNEEFEGLLSCVYSKTDVQKIKDNKKLISQELLDKTKDNLITGQFPTFFAGARLKADHIEKLFKFGSELSQKGFGNFCKAVYAVGGLALLGKFYNRQLSDQEYALVKKEIQDNHPNLAQLLKK